MTVFKDGTYGKYFSNVSTAHKSQFPRKSKVLEEASSCCIVPFDRDANFLHSADPRTSMLTVRL